MSQLPPCSGRPGIVRAPSSPTRFATSAEADPAWAFWLNGGLATSRLRCVWVEISSPSRRFHSARISADGAQPRMPGWMSPGNRTWGMCREEQKMPSKSQIALALESEGLVERAEREGVGAGHGGIYDLICSASCKKEGTDTQTYASGYNSSKNPPPLSL